MANHVLQGNARCTGHHDDHLIRQFVKGFIFGAAAAYFITSPKGKALQSKMRCKANRFVEKMIV
ncbi:hypothetical protein LX64_03851 [Chitinophaga skermanii]|uniref:Uncharacterized protein n=1 Tax=Chitinophaga skermanii TaxID=331697 RepID=A0A327QCW0_9BACT|nr:hypothetical protein [Chitinophaga skermanii]RAJ01634.1 hypothetical protein LX64_03851 [Chitinophaga skermanii]